MDYNAVRQIAADIIASMTNIAKAYGPAAADAAMALARIDAASKLINALVTILISAAIIGLTLKLRPRALVLISATSSTDPNDTLVSWMLSAVISAFPAGFVIANLIILTNVWIWIGLYRPELYIAAKALKMI